MLKKLFFIIVTFLSILESVGQDNAKPIFGMVKDPLGNTIQATIYNKRSLKGTTTNDFGVFDIYAIPGDTIQISSVGFTTKFLVATPDIFNNKLNQIILIDRTYQLDEVVIKNNLIGSLTIDSKKSPVDQKKEALKKTMDFSKVDMNAKVEDDHIDKKVRPPINNTDPNASFAGASAKVYISFKYSARLWALRRSIDFKQAFPIELKYVLGDEFFHDELKIPEDKYYHFLEYCNPLGIEQMYKSGKVLEVISLLKKESISYLQIQQKD